MQFAQTILPNWQNVIDYQALAARLRELRVTRRWTLERTASSAGLAPSTLSRFESNRRIPSLEHLVALGTAYNVPLADLLPPALSDPRIRTKANRVNGMVFRTLSPATSPLCVVEIAITKRRTLREPQTHAGREWIYVVSGVLSLRLGDSTMTMRAGEAAEFDTRLPHALDAESESVALIAIFSEEGRRVHLRLTR